MTERQLELPTDVHMDVDSVRAGAVLIVPSKVDGADIYAGDGHAMIGDGEIAVHTTDIAGRLVVRVEVIKGLALDGPILLPPAEDLPFLARPFTPRGRALARTNRTVLEGPVLPIQVLGSGPFVNAAVDNAIERAARLLGMGTEEVKTGAPSRERPRSARTGSGRGWNSCGPNSRSPVTRSHGRGAIR